MTDIWVCGTCHSINEQRRGRCYKCGARQEVAATGEMATLRQEQAIASRTVVAYRPAAALGLATSFFLLGLAVVNLAGIVQTFGLSSFLDQQLGVLEATGSIDEPAFLARTEEMNRLGLANLAVVLPALLFFAAWLSRVVSNVPALGGGIPSTSPGRAFVNTLIPLVNLRTVPGMVQDVLYRLDPRGGGVFMVGAAWFGLVGSWLVSFVAGWYLDLRLTFDLFNAASLEEAVASVRTLLTLAVAIDVATGALIAIGAVVLIALMIRIERRSRARDAEVRALAGV
ncbi:MAG TPA: DUF4328 domain-containing protein [Candidatus Limnocylindrales bacterium]|nr:DUF4328 domain-containing protein [Candidatus Limnocylindrales bacterium]HEU4920913.1 DUF4328 domain-containing protein [Candidatus Limnocylindrales bacterium]